MLDLGHFGNKLQRSTDCGNTWSECAVPAYADGDEVVTGNGNAPQPAALRLIWSLEAGAADQPGRLWAGTIPGGLFHSVDCGASWQHVRALWDMPERLGWAGGGNDQPGIHSICIDQGAMNCRKTTLTIWFCGTHWQLMLPVSAWRLAQPRVDCGQRTIKEPGRQKHSGLQIHLRGPYCRHFLAHRTTMGRQSAENLSSRS